MSQPHKCPVCEGRGRVPRDFYGETQNASKQIICQSCHGAGVLWEPAPVNITIVPAETASDINPYWPLRVWNSTRTPAAGTATWNNPTANLASGTQYPPLPIGTSGRHA